MLVIFSGCSGVGKNTIINNLMSKNDTYRLLPTYTTRNIRPGEREGAPYHFVSDEEFRRIIDSGDLYEYELVHDHYYGTSKKLLSDGVASGKTLMKDIDVNGALNLCEMLKDEIKIVTLFLYVESAEVLIERLVGRGEKDIELRLKRYDHEMSKKKYYSYLINNNSLENTSALVDEIVNFEQSGGKLVSSVCEGDISKAKIEEAIALYKSGDVPEPVKISVCDGKFCITEGCERYIASLVCEKMIAKDLTLVFDTPNICSDFDIYAYSENF